MLDMNSKPDHNDVNTPSARDKLVTMDQLSEIANKVRLEGRRVVLCHGVFDLVHMGHVRHLEVARNEGDVLIVTTTADKFVNKGPGRPIFSEQMRAEMLAAIEYVDWVAINPWPSAEPILDAVKPDVYVKGSDYENPEEDITGKIHSERQVVERHGGRIFFTKDVTFSSSNLINSYLNVYDPPLRDFLNNLRSDGGAVRILELIESISNHKVVLVGETIIDEYQYVMPLGKSSKENMIATHYQESEIFAGGVMAAANHVAEFCSEVEIVTTLGENCPYEEMIRSTLKPNIRLTVVRIPDRPTTRKLRYVDPGYLRKLFEVYFMDDSPLPQESAAELEQKIKSSTSEADVVIVTDFGHGMIDTKLVDVLRESARFLAVNSQTNGGNRGYNLITKYLNADYVCIDAPEARLAVKDKYSDIASIVGDTLPKMINCRKLIITHGSSGCYAMDNDKDNIVGRIPAFTKTVIDTVGAGDAFFAVTAPLVAAGGNITDIGFVGNAVGAMKVGIVGHRKSVEKIPLVKFVTTLLK